MSNRSSITGKLSQRGSATLVISVSLLLAITVMIFFIARTNLMEQRIAANDYRSEQAFEAAEAGIEYAIGRINKETPLNVTDTDNDTAIEFACTAGDAPGEGPCSVTTPGSNATARIALKAITAGNPNTIDIESTGFSDDLAASRKVMMQVAWVPLVGNLPPYPVVTRKEVKLNGTASVTNPPNTSAQKCIWSGKNAPALASGCQTDKDHAGLENASRDNFFTNFFLLSKTRFKSRSRVIDRTSNGGTNYSAKLNDAYTTDSARVIWIDGQTEDIVIDNSHGDLGTAGDPVVLIIDNFDDFLIKDNVTIHGLVYVAGKWDNVGDTATINGIALVEDDAKIGGGFLVNYDTDSGGVIDRLPNVGDYARIPGSWRDF